MLISMHVTVDEVSFRNGPRMHICSQTAVYKQHVNCLVNTWICAGKNMTVDSM